MKPRQAGGFVHIQHRGRPVAIEIDAGHTVTGAID